MADPTVRALRVLELLQSAPQRTVADMAGRLGVDERTVRRDVGRLREAGVEVESLRGRYGGYRLAPGRRVLPVVFSGEEVMAVYLALARAGAGEEPEVVVHTAMAKLRRAMRAGDAARVDAAIAVMRGAPLGDAGPDPAVMLALADAIDARRAVDLRYRNGKDVPSRRTVHPYGLAAHRRRWYLVALDTSAGEERAFRVDRVRSARALRKSFDPLPRSADLSTWLVDRFAGADYRWSVTLRIRATEDHIRRHLPPSVARLDPVGPTIEVDAGPVPAWHRAEIRAESLDWLPAVIAALDCEVLVDRPDELRDRVRDAAARMLRSASGGAG